MNPKRTMSQALHSVNLSAAAAAFVAAGAAARTSTRLSRQPPAGRHGDGRS